MGTEKSEIRDGLFLERSRKSAIEGALPLLSSYFADASTWDLEIAPQLSTRAAEEDAELQSQLASAVRLRASLAAGTRVVAILDEISDCPTFRYAQHRAESVGAIAGTLDVMRFLQRRHRVEVPRRYPIRTVAREEATPENVLAGYANFWMQQELRAIDTKNLPKNAPELRLLNQLQADLVRLSGESYLRDTLERAASVWRNGGIHYLIDQVGRRLEEGRIARAEPYAELHNWMSRTLQGEPVAEFGDHEWSFYDERFDTKLFEIWCLSKLAHAISTKLKAPTKPVRGLMERGQGPIYAWDWFHGTLELHFQANLATLGAPRWRYENGDGLRGFPDLVLKYISSEGELFALLDPKLRIRSAAPAEEIYKLIGYFGNLDYAHQNLGAILYYAPDNAKYYKLTHDEGGEIQARGIDPFRGDEPSFAALAESLVEGLTRDARKLWKSSV